MKRNSGKHLKALPLITEQSFLTGKEWKEADVTKNENVLKYITVMRTEAAREVLMKI